MAKMILQMIILGYLFIIIIYIFISGSFTHICKIRAREIFTDLPCCLLESVFSVRVFWENGEMILMHFFYQRLQNVGVG